MEQAGRLMVVAGVLIVLIGLALVFADRLPFRFGRLPLDIRFEHGNFSFYFPLGASILISIVISVIFMLINRR
jgi:hypothetical protein